MPVATPRLRVPMTLAIGIAHTNLAILGLASRLTYSVPSRYQLLREIMASNLWTWLHTFAALVIVGTLIFRRNQVRALAISAGIMGSWSFLNLLWGLSTNTPVSLVSPILGGAVTTMAYLLCLSWARSETGR